MAGSRPSWSCQPPLSASLWCAGQAIALSVPYRAVSLTVVTAGAGQVCFSASLTSAPRRGRCPPLVPAGPAAAGPGGA